MEVVHSGFDGLKFTVQTYISPEFRKALFEAKLNSITGNTETMIEIGGVALSVRRSGGMGFSAHTGEYGIEWYFVDPENRPPNNPGIIADFRAFLLATGGLKAAKKHFETCMAAFGIRYVETQLRVSRIDFAVDILAPWFEPDINCLVTPSRTKGSERADLNEGETYSNGARVTGLRVGAIANRQIAIYDKRAEILNSGKMGWEMIWDASLAKAGKPPLDLNDRDKSQVWRFELRMGSTQLRNKWEMRSWDDLETTVGDAFVFFCERIRYCIPSTDTNRSRWQTH